MAYFIREQNAVSCCALLFYLRAQKKPHPLTGRSPVVVVVVVVFSIFLCICFFLLLLYRCAR